MIDMEAKKQEIEANFKAAVEAEIALNQALIKLRTDIEWPENPSQEDIDNIMKLDREMNGRAAYILRALLVQHGNLLFL